MKHYLSIAAALTVSAMAAFAQTEAGGVLVIQNCLETSVL